MASPRDLADGLRVGDDFDEQIADELGTGGCRLTMVSVAEGLAQRTRQSAQVRGIEGEERTGDEIDGAGDTDVIGGDGSRCGREQGGHRGLIRQREIRAGHGHRNPGRGQSPAQALQVARRSRDDGHVAPRHSFDTARRGGQAAPVGLTLTEMESAQVIGNPCDQVTPRVVAHDVNRAQGIGFRIGIGKAVGLQQSRTEPRQRGLSAGGVVRRPDSPGPRMDAIEHDDLGAHLLREVQCP